MRCREARRRVSESIDGRLAGEDSLRAGLEAHLERCPACRTHRDRLTAAGALLDGLDRPVAPPGLTRRVLGQVLDLDRDPAAAPTPVPVRVGIGRGEQVYRAAVLFLLVSLNATLLWERRPGPEAAVGPSIEPAPSVAPIAAESVAPEPVVDSVDRYRDFFKTVEILAEEPGQAEGVRPVLARHVQHLPSIPPPVATGRAVDPEVAGYFADARQLVGQIRHWSEGQGEAPEGVRLEEIRDRTRAILVRSHEVRALLAGHEGSDISVGEIADLPEHELYQLGSNHFFAGEFEPAKRYLEWVESEEGEGADGPIADSARYLLARALARTGEGDRAAPIIVRLHRKGLLRREELSDILIAIDVDTEQVAVGPRRRVGFVIEQPGRRAAGDETARFFVVRVNGQEVDPRHGRAIRKFIEVAAAVELEAGPGPEGVHRRAIQIVDGAMRVEETLRLGPDGPEFHVQYAAASNEDR